MFGPARRLLGLISSQPLRSQMGHFRYSEGSYQVLLCPVDKSIIRVAFRQAAMGCLDGFSGRNTYSKTLVTHPFPGSVYIKGHTFDSRTVLIINPEELGDQFDYNCDFKMLRELFIKATAMGLKGVGSVVPVGKAHDFLVSLGFQAITTWESNGSEKSFLFQPIKA